MCRTLLFSAALAAALPAALPVLAEGPGPVTGPLRQIAISGDLYDRGVAAADPLMVLAAARMRKALDFLPPPGKDDVLTGWEEMGETARRLAAGDDAILDLVEDGLAEANKGVLIGPTYLNASFAAPDEPSVVEFDYRGGLLAEVYVEGRPGTNIDIQVRDAEGNLICFDNHPSHIAYCDWTPAKDGTFTVTIINRSGTADTFVLITN